MVNPGESAKKRRLHRNYKNIFANIDPEKLRKRFVKLLKERDEASAALVPNIGMLIFYFIFITITEIPIGNRNKDSEQLESNEKDEDIYI